MKARNLNMSTIIKITLVATFILGFVLPYAYYFSGKKSRSRFKKTLGVNVFSVFSGIIISTILAYNPDFLVFGAELAETTVAALKRQVVDWQLD